MKKIFLTLIILFSISAPHATAHQVETNRILDNIVVVVSPENAVYGTGFFISPHGHILTNEHVISAGRSFQLCFRNPGHETGVTCYFANKLKVLAKDSYLDLALLQVPQTADSRNNYLTFGNSNSSKVGDKINIFGYPEADLVSLKLSKGLISKSTPSYILTDAAVLHGNSGSPVLNNKNEVIGIAAGTFGAKYKNAGVLIPSNVAKDWLTRLRFSPKKSLNF